MLTTIKKGSTKEEVIKQSEKQLKKKSLNIRKYCGILSSKKDPVALQKMWRDEWQ